MRNQATKWLLTNDIYICRLCGMKAPRLSPQTLLILEAFLVRPSAWRYGYELSRETELKSGTLYPILMRLAKYGLLETKWVATEEGVPPRHTYRLTTKGMELARAQQKPATHRALKARRAAFSGGKA
jgi:PadR family transcriptional regulator, regulatory protein PadR